MLRKPSKREAKLQKQLDDAQAEIEALKRTQSVLEAERDSMAEVIARDRERIRSELAIYAAKTASAETIK